MIHFIESVAAWLAGALFLCALLVLAGYCLRGPR